MNTRILIAICAIITSSVMAVDRITATITITNATVNGDTILVNASTRTATNSIVTPANQFLIGANVGAAATNLWNHIVTYPFLAIQHSFSSTNTIKLVGQPGGAVAVSFGGTWAEVSYSTQVVTSVTTVRVPMSAVTAYERTNTATLLTTGLGQYALVSMPQTSVFSAELVGLTNNQTISGRKSWTDTNIFSAIIMTNGINYGLAFRSPGSGTYSEQMGWGADAIGDYSVALGASATAGQQGSVAVGNTTSANRNSVAVGYGATATGSNSVSIGASALNESHDAIAIGQSATVTHSNSVAIGKGATTTVANQIKIGSSAHAVSIPGTLTVSGGITNTTLYGTVGQLSGGFLNAVGMTNTLSTNLTTVGTNTYGGITVFPISYNTSLANGNNAGIDFGTTTVVDISAGPTAAFAICGISGGINGRLLILHNETGFNMTLAHNSGVDATPANRIYTSTGADMTITNSGSAMLIYDSNDTKWHIHNLQP